MELYFLRHADAGVSGDWKGRDFERPLSDAGAARMTEEASAIARLHPALDAILTSPLLRARQTAEILAKTVQAEGVLIVDERLAPGFGAPELKKILAERRSCTGLLLVGHERTSVGSSLPTPVGAGSSARRAALSGWTSTIRCPSGVSSCGSSRRRR